jgi:hypothetical protein
MTATRHFSRTDVVDYQILEGPISDNAVVLNPFPDGFTSVSPFRAFSYTLFISLPCCTNLPATMKSLLRKKTPTDNVKNPPPSSSTQRTRQPTTVETPLYARFASSKSAAQSLEGTRPIVSGPMPLGRPRASAEADSRRKHEENLSRRRLSSGRRGLASPEPQLDPREVQSSLDRPSQDVPVELPRPPAKTQIACKLSLFFPMAWRSSPPPHYAVLDGMTLVGNA